MLHTTPSFWPRTIPINSDELTENLTLFPLLHRARARQILQYVNNSLKKIEERL